MIWRGRLMELMLRFVWKKLLGNILMLCFMGRKRGGNRVGKGVLKKVGRRVSWRGLRGRGVRRISKLLGHLCSMPSHFRLWIKVLRRKGQKEWKKREGPIHLFVERNLIKMWLRLARSFGRRQVKETSRPWQRNICKKWEGCLQMRRRWQSRKKSNRKASRSKNRRCSSCSRCKRCESSRPLKASSRPKPSQNQATIVPQPKV